MSESKLEGNRKYKDRLFVFLFGSEERKEWTLELYNAINGTDYTDASAIEFNTLDSILYIRMGNDVSFILDGSMSLFEHQSTFNPNMPLRMLDYLVELIRSYCKDRNYNYYMTRGIPLPNPRFVVFSNWKGDDRDESALRLRDLFINPQGEADIELNVRVININQGYNERMMRRCRPLLDYSIFVEAVREYRRRGIELGPAIDRAIDELPNDSIIGGLLQRNRTEVKGMLETEDQAKYVMDMYYHNGKVEGLEEGRAEGKAEGIEEGRAEGKAERNKEIAALYNILIKKNRNDDFAKALSNEEYLNQLLRQYGLI